MVNSIIWCIIPYLYVSLYWRNTVLLDRVTSRPIITYIYSMWTALAIMLIKDKEKRTELLFRIYHSVRRWVFDNFLTDEDSWSDRDVFLQMNPENTIYRTREERESSKENIETRKTLIKLEENSSESVFPKRWRDFELCIKYIIYTKRSSVPFNRYT